MEYTMTERRSALIAIILCVLFWGFSFVSIKVTVAVFPPMTLGALRFAIALAVLFFFKRSFAAGERLSRRDLPLLAGAGLTGVTLYFFCENTGVSLVTASEASIIISAIPVISMFAEWGAAKMRRSGSGSKTGSSRAGISVTRILGTAVSVAGVWLVASLSFSVSGSVAGYVYMLGAALSWVAYCFCTRPLFENHSRIFIVFWQSFFGFLGFIPFALMESSRWLRPDFSILAHLLFLAVCCSALGYWFYARSLEVLGIGVSTIFVNLVPVITVIAGFLVLGERLLPFQWLGAALVISGVYLTLVKGPN
ncbi:MAG: DMT family transporter [Spirochaetaceae bacterium]|jgi:drug/metabolite transporter (DMT)-like permease|nr:DMT family transporter [Spirochaetaceae bacterium]